MPRLNEFETFVEKRLGVPLQRFGSGLILETNRGFATAATTTVPPDYRLNPGDTLLISVTGSVESQLRLSIDRDGRIFIPKVGVVNVAGVRYGDLTEAVSRRFQAQFKGAVVSVTIAGLHGLTVYVTGYAVRPGSYTVSSLSTMVDAVLTAGGPSSGGSFRVIELRRDGRLLATLDLYDLLLNGDKSHDAVLQNGDVLNVSPAGPEVAVAGSVNSPAIFEAKSGESLADVIRYAGGFTSLADRSRVVIARLSDADTTGTRSLDVGKLQTLPAEAGEIVQVLSQGDIAEPRERQAVLATIEGEVTHPGKYFLRPGATMADLLGVAGGLSTGAFVFGAELDRQSVQRQQKVSFDRALSDLELAVAASPAGAASDKVAAGLARQQAIEATIRQLRNRRPDGRLILDLAYGARDLPGTLGLENLDRIYVPPRPRTIGVFGAVYQPGSQLFTGSQLGSYLKAAGGLERFADGGAIFVVRANGAVLSLRHNHGLLRQPALDGDLIYAPIRTTPGLFEKVLEVAAVVYQFGVGALTLKALGI